MIRNLKILGPVMVVALMAGAIAAPAAPAQFTASGYPTTFTATSGPENGYFETEAGKVECAAHFSGSLPNASTTLTVSAAYQSCEALGLGAATVNMNGCHYAIHDSGVVDLACPPGKTVTIVAGTCEVQVSAQMGLSSIALEDDSPHIDALATVRGINYSVIKDGLLCPFSGTGAKTGGKYIQNSDVTIKSVSGAPLTFDPPPQDQFTASSYPTTVTAASPLGNGYFNTEAGKVECAEHFIGTYGKATTTLTIAAAYTNCEAFGFTEAAVAMNGCDYAIHSDGKVDLVCPGGKEVSIVAGPCEVRIKPQSGLKLVVLENNAPHIDFLAFLRGIQYSVVKDGVLCPFNGLGEKSGGEYIHDEEVTLVPVEGGTSISLD